jgi:hypothetical protein
VIEAYFGDPLLFACYEFYGKFGHKPANWKEVFEFFNYCKANNVLKEAAIEAAKAGRGGE